MRLRQTIAALLCVFLTTVAGADVVRAKIAFLGHSYYSVARLQLPSIEPIWLAANLESVWFDNGGATAVDDGDTNAPGSVTMDAMIAGGPYLYCFKVHGQNDAVEGFTEAQFKAAIQAQVDELLINYTCGQIRISYPSVIRADEFPVLTAGYRTAIEEVIAETALSHVQIGADYGDSGLLAFEDSNHLNDEGNTIMAHRHIDVVNAHRRSIAGNYAPHPGSGR